MTAQSTPDGAPCGGAAYVLRPALTIRPAGIDRIFRQGLFANQPAIIRRQQCVADLDRALGVAFVVEQSLDFRRLRLAKIEGKETIEKRMPAVGGILLKNSGVFLSRATFYPSTCSSRLIIAQSW
ncbi:MAG TPA: hypothetical protein VN809_07070 [Telmatospirillum sp.]|nr:hypothetical protein [Telmatospirillum sp.]